MNLHILVTDYSESGINVMIINPKTITPQIVETALKAEGQIFGEVHEVEPDEMHLYCYEPLWADDKFEKAVINKAI